MSVNRKQNLDGLRALAFLSVFVHHALGAPLLWAGVDLFFVLSGYLITGILIRNKATESYFTTFYGRRFFRIFPPYYLTLAVVAGCGAVTLLRRSDWLWYGLYLSNVSQSFGLAPTHPQLTHMWSLAVEEQFYLIWPLIVSAVSVKHLRHVCVGLIVVAPCVRIILTILHPSAHWPVYELLPSRIDLLAAGALLAQLEATSADNFLRVLRVARPMAVVALGVFLALAWRIHNFRTSANALLFNALGYSLICAVACGALAWALSAPRDGVLTRVLSAPQMIYVGRISYALYLVHMPVLVWIGGLGGSKVVTAIASLLITIAVAAFSWRFLEGPLGMVRDRIFAYGPAPATTASTPSFR